MAERYPEYVLGGIPGCFLVPGALALLEIIPWSLAVVAGSLAALALVGHALFREPPTDPNPGE